MDQKNFTEVNALHKTTNITEWMKNAIEDYLLSKKYTIHAFLIEAEIMTRMGKINIMNTITLKIVDDKGNLFTLENYNSSNKEIDNLKLSWLIEFIKQKENEAVRRFTEKPKECLKTQEELNVEFNVLGKKTKEDFSYFVFFASNVNELMRFFSDQQFQLIWAGPTAVIKETTLLFENVILEGVKQASPATITLKYKWSDWEEFSHVDLSFTQVGDCVKVVILQKNIPVGLKDNVKNQWNSKIFYPISILFKCPLRPVL